MHKQSDDFAFLSGGGAMGRQIAVSDWSTHPLGDISTWKPAFRTALSMVLNSGFPSYILWGKEFFAFYNDAYIPILGNKVSLGQGNPLVELWPEIKDAACAIAEEAFAGGSPYFEDRPFVLERHGSPETTYFTFSYSPVRDGSGNICGVLCTIVETTDKVIALSRSKESEDRLKLSLDASGTIGTWSVDLATGNTIVDERFARLFQVDAALAQSGTQLERFTNMIHPDDRERVLGAIAHAMGTGETYDIEYRIPQLSGKIVWVAVKGKVFEDSKTGQMRFAGVAVDVTERKKIELELSDASRRKDEFLAMLAHELRNPLAPISAAAEILQRVKLDDKRIQQTSATIVRQVAHMTNLVNDLLDVSRVTRGLVTLNMAPLNIKNVVTDAVEQVAPLIRTRRHRLVMHLAPDATMVSGDKERLVQVVANLVNNAAKYTQEGGNIVLKSELYVKHVLLEVIDDGIGMPPELTGRVFDLFAQAEVTPDRSSGGLGLGLALVKSLVELHHGTVTCESAGVGKGSKFTIFLPRLLTDERSNGAQALDYTLKQSIKALRIMVIDDNLDAAAMLAMLLEAAGHQVAVEHGARRALERSKEEASQVFLLDIGLPEIDGYELAQRLRAQPETANAVLIAVTGYGQDSDRGHALAAGFDHHLVKPVDTAKLAAILAGIISV